MNASIRSRIRLAVALPIAGLVIVAALSLASLAQLIDTLRSVAHTLEVRQALAALQTRLVDAETGERGFAITGNPSFLEPYQDARTEIDTRLQRLRQLTADNPNQQQRIRDLVPAVRTELALLEEAITARRNEGRAAAADVVNSGRGKQYMDRIRGVLGAMDDEERALLERRQAAAHDSALAARWTILAVAAGLGALALAAALAITRSLGRRLAGLQRGAELIGRGVLDHRLETRSPGDELDALGAAFNDMAERRARAEAALRDRAAERERIFQGIRASTERLRATSQELVATADRQVTGGEQQAASVRQLGAFVESANAATSRSVHQAEQTVTAVQRSESVAQAGRQAADDGIQLLRDAKAHTDANAERILALAEHAQAIGRIVALVADLSTQTNMLALNASIEAQRSGEHGRGFGVVASEVRALAERAKAATLQIRRLLGEIQRLSNAAVITTEQGTRSVHAAMRAASHSGETIANLEAVIAALSSAVADIASVSREHAQNLGQVRQAVADVNAAVASALEAARQTGESARDMEGLGRDLTGLVLAPS